MYLHCNICNKTTDHYSIGRQPLPSGDLDYWRCPVCEDSKSTPASGYTELTNDYNTGQPMLSTGQQLTRAQEREVLHQPGKWDGGSYVVSKPKRGLFG